MKKKLRLEWKARAWRIFEGGKVVASFQTVEEGLRTLFNLLAITNRRTFVFEGNPYRVNRDGQGISRLDGWPRRDYRNHVLRDSSRKNRLTHRSERITPANSLAKLRDFWPTAKA